MRDLLIVRPFNWVFFLLIAVHLAATFLLIKKYRETDEETKRKFVARLYVITFVIFVLYKALLPLDQEYMLIYPENWGEFTYWNELPFNLCNVTLLFLPVAMWTKNRAITTFCFFGATFGPLLSLLMPLTGFAGYSLLSIHVAGYYYTHLVILMAPLFLSGLNLYQPKYKDIPYFMLALVCVGAVMFGVNIVLRKTGLCPKANYFFTIDQEKNPLLEMLYRWIPIPFVYSLPIAPVFGLAGCGVTAIYHLFTKKKAEK